MNGEVGLMQRHAEIWRTLYSPTSPLFGTNIVENPAFPIAFTEWLPANINRFLIFMIASNAFDIRFPFMRTGPYIIPMAADELHILKIEDYGPLLQDVIEIRLAAGVARAMEVFIKK